MGVGGIVDRGRDKNVSFQVGSTKLGGCDRVGDIADDFEGVGEEDLTDEGFAVSFLIDSEFVNGGAGGPDFLGSRSFGGGGGVESVDFGDGGDEDGCFLLPATMAIAWMGTGMGSRFPPS